MKYNKTIKLNNGITLTLRNATIEDAKIYNEVFKKIRTETDFLRTYPEENIFDEKKEKENLQEKENSKNEVEILAFAGDTLVGTAGIYSLGTTYKVKHRAEFGIEILKDFQGFGIGTILTEACIECAKKAGYKQLELDVVAENTSAINLYKKFKFVEFGRNPKGFYSKTGKYQELIYMRLEL